MKLFTRSEDGFTLLGVLMVLAIFSILGFSILAVTAGSVKLSDSERDDQSVFYIAEAGLVEKVAEIEGIVDSAYEKVSDRYNRLTSKEKANFDFEVEFYKEVTEKILLGTTKLSAFESNFEENPEATVSISRINTENPPSYKVESEGKIGKSKRKVYTVVSLNWDENEDEDSQIIEDILFYSKKFSFHGNSVNAVSGSVIMDGIETHSLNGGSSLNITNMYFNGPVKMDGGSASFGSEIKPGHIYVNGDLDFWEGRRNVYGDLRVNGKFKLKDAVIHGDVYVNGDLELEWTPEIKKNIYYTGKLIVPSNYSQSLLNKVIKVDRVDSFKIPTVDFELKEDSWYINNGYILKDYETGKIPPNTKMLVNNYINTDWQEIKGQAVIISKGDIVLRGGNGFTGALIAPNGKVEYSGDGVFNGIIISKNEISLPQGGNIINFKSLNEIFGSDIPLKIRGELSEDNDRNDGNGSSEKHLKLTVTSGVREK